MVQVQARRSRSNPLRHMCLVAALAPLSTLMVVLHASKSTPSLRKLEMQNGDNNRTPTDSTNSKSSPSTASLRTPLPLPSTTASPHSSKPHRQRSTWTQLTYKKPSYIPARSSHTLDEFVVNGVNLAEYGYENVKPGEEIITYMEHPYLLYENFDIEDQLSQEGKEGWFQLVDYHANLRDKGLTFYSDKVAAKRWMSAMGIPRPKSTFLLYKHELDSILRKHQHQGSSVLRTPGDLKEQEYQAMQRLLPERKSFVAKPTNRACSSGVWVVKHDDETDKTWMGYGGEFLEKPYDKETVAKRMTDDLNRIDENCGDWAMHQMKPGFIIEDRFSSFDYDDAPAMEFKLFTIWGRVWIANWRRGNRRPGLVHRNGTVVEWSGKHSTSLPSWVNWDGVVEIAERLARHKDMYRVDIFVGVPAGHPALKSKSRAEQLAAVQIRVSETEFVPSTHLKDPGLFEEASRLWMAGYKMGIHKLIPNNEVPKAFLAKGYLTEEDAKALEMDQHFAPIRLGNNEQ